MLYKLLELVLIVASRTENVTPHVTFILREEVLLHQRGVLLSTSTVIHFVLVDETFKKKFDYFSLLYPSLSFVSFVSECDSSEERGGGQLLRK